MTNVTHRQAALPTPGDPVATALARLVEDRRLAPDQAAAVLREVALVTGRPVPFPRRWPVPTPAHAPVTVPAPVELPAVATRRQRTARALGEVLAHTVVAASVAAALVALAPLWAQVGRAERLALLLGPALLVAVLAMVLARGGDCGPGTRRVVGVLVALDAAVVAAAGLQLPDDPPALAGALALTGAAASAYACWQTGPTHLLVAGGAVAAVALGPSGDRPLLLAAGLWALALAWLLLARSGVLRERVLALALSGVLVGAAAQVLLADPTTRHVGAGTLVALAASAGGAVALRRRRRGGRGRRRRGAPSAAAA